MSLSQLYQLDVERTDRILLRIPVAATLLFALILGSRIWFVPTHFYSYTDTEYLNRLFTQTGFTQLLFHKPFFYPWQNLNPLSWAALHLVPYLPGNPTAWLWLGQTALVYLALSQLSLLLRRWIHHQEHGFFWALLLFHPGFWLLTLTAPSQVLTLCLFLRALDLYPDPFYRLHRWFFSLLLLSFSGSLGWAGAITLAGGQAILRFIKVMGNRKRIREAAPLALISLAAVTPATVLFLLLTFEFKILGGPWLSSIPTFFSGIFLAKFLNGFWTVHSRELLLWLGQGLIDLPFLFPLFGGLSLLGLISARREHGFYHHLMVLLTGLLLILFVFLSFSERILLQEYSLFLFVVLLFFSSRGYRWVKEKLPPPQARWAPAFLGVFALLFLVSMPSQWQTALEKASYYLNIHQSLCDWTSKSKPCGFAGRAVPFTPAIHAHLDSLEVYYPLGLTIQMKTAYRNQPRGGIRLDLNQTIAPEQILLFADFETARLLGPGSLPKNRWLNAIQDYYDVTYIQNLAIYTRKPGTRDGIQNRLVQQSAEEEQSLDWLTAQAWFRGLDEPRHRFPVQVAKRIGESHQQRVGQQWSFEEDYSFTRRIGIAFGFSPDHSHSAIGLSSAGPGSPQVVKPLGLMESDPFVIEGQDMYLMADLPRDSTESLICLAVYSQEPYGETAPTKKARHIFEHNDQGPLLGDTFYYIRPEQLSYEGGRIKGWRVVREARGGQKVGWQWIEWSLDPWHNRPAVWLAADRDNQEALWIDEIIQKRRPPGYYWNFEDGTYQGWEISGTALGTGPALSPYGNQQTISGYEGNYFINTFYQGSDSAFGTLTSPPIPLTLNQITFRVGGGNDPYLTYVSLVVNGQIVQKASGRRNESLYPVTWDLTPWLGQEARIQIVDQSATPWGHLLVDDIRIFNAPEPVNAQEAR